ncbi:preprotein translocase subunit SecE [candidate division KSB3 bacterium]|uniref:Protein translocase subunit SecE n=1 Tax=candidate division KSB3 bacterium TaxID=2044937 RepID=A0A2G6K7V1_9BACT|nr:MAG: preprotein translocase subunit SecE [candidate division KSB3 bacterium]
MKKLIQFLKEARVELKKVSWPTRKEVIGSTTIVIVVSVLSGLFLGLLDVIFFRSVYGLISWFGM